jgi:hypothetical protein
MTHPSLGKLEMTHPSLERLKRDLKMTHPSLGNVASSLRNTEIKQILSVWSLQAFLSPRFSYNFQPPTASAQEPVASMLIEEAGAGVEEPDLSSRESSMSIEFDFGSTEDHIMR